MTRLLALETSTSACSAALSDGDTTFCRHSEQPRSHSTLLLEMLDQVLADAKFRVNDLHCIAVTTGPGSFTGLRIGFGVVQGLAYAHDVPVIGVSTLQVLTAKYHRLAQLNSATVVMPVLDARMSQVHCAVIRLEPDGAQEILISDCLLEMADFIRLVDEQRPDIIVGETEFLTKTKFCCPTMELLPEALDVLTVASLPVFSQTASSVQQVELKYMRGRDAWQKHQPVRG